MIMKRGKKRKGTRESDSVETRTRKQQYRRCLFSRQCQRGNLRTLIKVERSQTHTLSLSSTHNLSLSLSSSHAHSLLLSRAHTISLTNTDLPWQLQLDLTQATIHDASPISIFSSSALSPHFYPVLPSLPLLLSPVVKLRESA